MAFKIGSIRKSIIDAIVNLPCRPEHANYLNTPTTAISTELPRMDVQFLSTVNEEFSGSELIQTQLVQIDLFIGIGEDMKLMEDYIDAINAQFRNHKDIGGAKVVDPPSVGFSGVEGNAYRRTLSIAFEYLIDHSTP